MVIKQRITKLFLFAIFVNLAFGMNISFVSAEGEQSFADFTAEAKLPENQFTKDVTYFDVKVGSGQKQQLEVVLTNRSSKEIEIIPSINRAQTNRSGVVTYSIKSKDDGSGLKYNIEDIVKIGEKKIVLKANEEYVLKLQIDMPDEPFDGILAGGLYLLNNTTEETDGNLKNHFAREIGILLRESENSNDILGELELVTARGGQKDSRNIISVLLENSQPAYLNNFSIKGTVTKKGETKPNLKLDKENLAMAPNSRFDLPLSLNGNPFAAGDYIFKAQAKQGERTWDLEKEFKITAEEARKYNKQDVDIDKTNIFDNKLVVAMILILILLIFIIIILIIRMVLNNKKKKKRKKNLKRKRKNSNRKKVDK